MNYYEILQDKADAEGLTVREKPLKANDGLIKGNRIAIRDDLVSNTEKSCILAEELGHHYTTHGTIIDQSDNENRKQELKARAWAYNQMSGLSGIIKVYETGCHSLSEAAECLNVTEAFFLDAMEYYRNKYGIAVRIDQYIIYFEPSLGIFKME